MKQAKTIWLITILVTGSTLAGIYSGGSGTEGDPYLIEEPNDILEMSITSEDWDSHFLMVADIDMSGYTFTKAVIAPDLDDATSDYDGIPFTGIFDGSDHKIVNLTIDTAGVNNHFLGLFGKTNNVQAQVINLGLENVSVLGGDESSYLGGLCAYNQYGTIDYCYAAGSVSRGRDVLGGLCGINSEGTISNSFANSFVEGSNAYFIGGLCGFNHKGTISKCYSKGYVGGVNLQYVGGLCGVNTLGGLISLCYAANSTEGKGNSYTVGGLIGGVGSNSIVRDCYAAGPVSGYDNVGGLCGQLYNSGNIIERCYSTGSVTGVITDGTGGFWGRIDLDSGILKDCFWDTQTSGTTVGVGEGASDGLLGMTTEQMQTPSTFTSAGWDFIDTDGDPADWWMPSNSYPRLSWEVLYGGGTGTAQDPYQIWTPQQMNMIGLNSDDWASYFKLMTDIDMSAYTGTQYNVIGNLTTKFTGTFDGNGHVISNLTITAASQDFVGLFGYVINGQIRNLGMDNMNITGDENVGGLVAYSGYGTITNSHTSGMVSGSSYVGGLVGINHKSTSTITSCYTTGSINGSTDFVGGLVGMNAGAITSCYTTGSINSGNGSNCVGGLVGGNEGSIITCYATGSVNGDCEVGGLVGENYAGTVAFCYATGSVSGSSVYIGGLVGWNSGTTTSCFWDTQTSGQTDGVGNQNPDPSGVTGKTTKWMKSQSTFTDAGWDFSSTDGDPAEWWLPAGHYPHLSWETLYGGGTGTAENPYQIWTPEQMNAIGVDPNDWSSCFKLVADIDMSAYTDTQYRIIGNQVTPFAGTFDGNGHVISSLTINAPLQDNVGLFGHISAGGLVRNLSLESVTMTGFHNVGGLAGWNDSGTLTGCSMTGSVSGAGHIGGLTGRNKSGLLIACSAAASVSGANAIGGLTGANYSASVGNCYAAGSVSGTGNYIGGLTGYNNQSIMTTCYAADLVGETGTRVGGLIGWNSADSVVTACFWDTLISNKSNGIGGGSPDGITGKTTAEMQTLSTFSQAGWDFTNEMANGTNDYWRMCIDGVDYPCLNWESTEGDFDCPDGVHTEDLDYYTDHWLMNDCTIDNNYCGGADLNYSGAVDLADWAIFADNWLHGVTFNRNFLHVNLPRNVDDKKNENPCIE